MRALLGGFIFLFSSAAFPCSFDSDCDVGAKCIKSGYSSNGVCVEDYGTGRNPRDSGRKYDYETRSYGSKKGHSCTGSYECGVGGECLKSSGLYGTCTK